ncbi:MAG: glycosyltransferase family 2 protein [Acidobacteriota bacterium]
MTAPSEGGAPRVSVIIATHNRAELLPVAIESILAQSLQDFEIVPVDDASTDGTSEVLGQLAASDPRIRPLRAEQNLGPGGARNLGIQHARGEYVAVLDDDERAEVGRLERQVEFMDAHPQVAAVFSGIRWVDAEDQTLRLSPGPILRDELPRSPTSLFRLLYLHGNRLPNGTLLARRQVMLDHPYAPELRIAEDWLLFLELTAHGLPLASVPEALVRSLRDEHHTSQMSNKELAFRCQRKALRMLRRRLRRRGIRQFKWLHRRAFARQLVREARYWYGRRGLALVARAMTIAPYDAAPWRASLFFSRVLGLKLRRALGA